MPWSLRQPPRPERFELPNAHAANEAIVRVDVHESLGATEARDLVVAVRKVAAYYRASRLPNALETVESVPAYFSSTIRMK
jgi:hypothetical protein